ncbi:MAG: fructose-1,6-bisphosphatase [Bacteroidales bacterium]|nr:fructose-1,6-bisphosphatase [Bacteroidales bacterium]
MKRDIKYLRLLSKSFPTVQAACTEIINLEAIMNLPKGTEHFITDLHGENEAVEHVLRNASGVIKQKVEDLFGDNLMESARKELCTLIYYPEAMLKIMKQREKDLKGWYKVVLMRLVRVLAESSSKYTRSKVRKALPAEYSYIIEELLHESKSVDANKHNYIMAIVETIISTGRADHFITAICNVIQRLVIDCLHVIGDIYDRGPGAHLIMDRLCEYHNADIQWGNHDVVWMGAAAGSKACVANVLRMCFRYANLTTLEDGYGINILPLATFAMNVYGNDPCTVFRPKINEYEVIDESQARLISQMHKAISVIQWKLEARVVDRRKEFGMEGRKLLHLIDFEKGTVKIDGVDYKLKDSNFPTINPKAPYELTAGEKDVITKLTHSFTVSPRLEKHVNCLLSRGSLYLVMNDNLLFHGSIPLNEDGSFKEMEIMGRMYSGKALCDKIDQVVRTAFYSHDKPSLQKYGQDFLWYLWCGPVSPPFDKGKMATFERYLLSDKEPQKEPKGWYYTLKNRKDICEKILKEFGVENYEHGHIINGHIPVKAGQGENPIKAEGKLLVIDGGFSKAYQKETGIGGYTLTFNSYGLKLVQHEPFVSKQTAIEKGVDIRSMTKVVENAEQRIYVRDTDKGKELAMRIDDLRQLVQAYRNGSIRF